MTDTSAYKERLTEEHARLEEEMKSIAQPNPSNPGEWEAIQTDTVQEADPNDQAAQLDEYQENRAVVDVLNARLQDVNNALTRIEDGTYGTCEVGNEDIEPERLDADPTAKTCKMHL